MSWQFFPLVVEKIPSMFKPVQFITEHNNSEYSKWDFYHFWAESFALFKGKFSKFFDRLDCNFSIIN